MAADLRSRTPSPVPVPSQVRLPWARPAGGFSAAAFRAPAVAAAASSAPKAPTPKSVTVVAAASRSRAADFDWAADETGGWGDDDDGLSQQRLADELQRDQNVEELSQMDAALAQDPAGTEWRGQPLAVFFSFFFVV